MPEKYFLSLDYENSHHALAVGLNCIGFLEKEFGGAVKGKLGVKINQDMFTGSIYPGFRQFTDSKHDIFADMKVTHGADTGKRIFANICKDGLSVQYVTVFAGLGSKILKDYVEIARPYGMNVVAFTAHTKIPEGEVREMYKGENMDDVILNLGAQAYRGECHAIVLEAERLKDERIKSLQLKKLVTGIRIDPEDAGSQSRVTSLGKLAELKDNVNYVVVSSKYLENHKLLASYFEALL